MKLAFLASNNGCGLRALVAAIEAGELAAEAAPAWSATARRRRPWSLRAEHGVAALCIPTTR